MSDKSNKIMKTAVFMVVITFGAKLLGMLRDILLASNYGTTADAIAYDAASRLPVLLFDFVLGGVVTAAFIPVFNEILVKKGKKEAFDYANKYINMILLITLIITVAGILFSRYLVGFIAPDISADVSRTASYLTRIMFPMVIFTGLAFSFVGLLQSFGNYLLPAFISFASNLIMVAYFFTFNSSFGVTGLSVAMLVGWSVQAFIQMPAVHKIGYRYKPTLNFRSEYIKKSLLMAIPILLSSWTQPVCNFINSRFASSISEGRAFSAIGYANRLYIIIVGVFTFVATNLLFPKLSKSQAEGDTTEADKLTSSSIRVLLLVILPLSIGIFVFAEPLISIIYERGAFTHDDVKLTASALRYFAIGMPFFAVNEVYAKRFFSEQKTIAPMLSSIISICVNIVAVVVLSRYFGLAGIAFSSSLAIAVNLLINHLIFIKKGKSFIKKDDCIVIAKMLVSALVMGGAVYFADRYIDALPIITVAAGAALGCALYFAVCYILEVPEVKNFLKKK